VLTNSRQAIRLGSTANSRANMEGAIASTGPATNMLESLRFRPARGVSAPAGVSRWTRTSGLGEQQQSAQGGDAGDLGAQD